MTFLFSWFWYHFFAGTMYTYRFYRRGNYVIIGMHSSLFSLAECMVPRNWVNCVELR